MNLIRVSDDVWLNPDQGNVEMVYRETVGPDGTPLAEEDQFVVFRFQHRETGWKLPPSYKLEDVIESLAGGSNLPPVVNNVYYEPATTGLNPKAKALFIIAIILGFLGVVIGLANIIF